MQFIPNLNTCERPLTPGTQLYPILIHADLTLLPPGEDGYSNPFLRNNCFHPQGQ